MNQSQLKYAQGRAKTIFDARKTRLKASHTIPAVTFDHTDIRRALNARQFKVVDKGSRGAACYLSTFIEFPGETAEVFHEDAYKRDLAVLTLTYDRLMDELVLGDHQEALKLLRAFEEA